MKRIVWTGFRGTGKTEVGKILASRLNVPFFDTDDLVETSTGRSIPDIFRRPNSELFAWLKSEVSARGVRGVILARQVWCDKWHAEVERFRQWLNVPLLDVDLDGEPCGTRTRTRIQAFMESLR
jgi:benzoyl-CoA reductase/2-hydroxyglutaryl-CoA dehydratase subunit BcrC/BadD/HgdB